jgi:pimeloyl-ACP methyl ester carboxylesterase
MMSPPAGFALSPQQPMMPPPFPPQSYATLPVAPQLPPNVQPRSRKKWVYGVAAGLGIVLIILVTSSGLFLYQSSTRSMQASATRTASVRTQATEAAYKTAYQTSPCPFSIGDGIVEGKDVTCGYLTVPENRDQPHGKTIQLAVAVFKGSTNPGSVPDLYLTGGPGGGVLSDFGPYITRSNLQDVTLGHTFILLDQRGTGYSRPALDCHEFSDLDSSTADQTMTYGQENKVYVQAAKQCHDRLVQSGVDLNAYTTISNATDVHDLIHALGYEQVNLYGVSYGTRLALTFMRLFPGDLRSVILDSTVPTQSNLFTSLPAVTQHAFNVLFAGCAKDAHCHSAYPQVESVFYKLVTRLNAHPISFQDVRYGLIRLDGDGLANWLFSAMYVTRLIPLLPETIMQINDGNYKLISQYYGYIEFEGGISYGMYYSVECGEDLAFLKPQDLVAAANVARPEIRTGLLADMQDSYDVCQSWGVKPVPLVQKQPVISSVPTLILSGEYDPITPFSNAQMAQRTLSNSFLYLFPATGHGVFYTDNCPDTIMVDFLSQPTTKPDSACISLMSEPNFQ